MGGEGYTLQQYLVEETELGDLATLAFLSGVEYSTLQRLSDGEVVLDPSHRAAICRVLPGVPSELLDAHDVPLPLTHPTRRGCLPEGHTLLLVPALQLQSGDLAAYVPKSSGPGSHWIEVISVRQQAYFAYVQLAGGVEMVVSQDHPVRVARIC